MMTRAQVLDTLSAASTATEVEIALWRLRQFGGHMALLTNIGAGDHEDCRDFSAPDDAEVYGTCPTCGTEHGAGYCPEVAQDCGLCGFPLDNPDLAVNGRCDACAEVVR